MFTSQLYLNLSGPELLSWRQIVRMPHGCTPTSSVYDTSNFPRAHADKELQYEGNKTAGAKENITHCSNRTALFHFDPTTIIENELAPGLNLSDIHWPSGIEDGIHAIEVASKVMFVFYVIGIVFAGLAFLGAIVGVLSESRLIAFFNFAIDMSAFLAVGIASAIATAIMIKAVNAINKYGGDIGVAAYKGTEFLGMTWAATALLLLASFLSIAECCAGRRRTRRALAEKPV